MISEGIMENGKLFTFKLNHNQQPTTELQTNDDWDPEEDNSGVK